jgi:hypothetical protein
MERLEREMAEVAEAEATAAAANEMFGPMTAERLVQEAGLERDDALMAELSERINVRSLTPSQSTQPATNAALCSLIAARTFTPALSPLPRSYHIYIQPLPSSN